MRQANFFETLTHSALVWLFFLLIRNLYGFLALYVGKIEGFYKHLRAANKNHEIVIEMID
jgi:hypothetical protein